MPKQKRNRKLTNRSANKSESQSWEVLKYVKWSCSHSLYIEMEECFVELFHGRRIAKCLEVERRRQPIWHSFPASASRSKETVIANLGDLLPPLQHAQRRWSSFRAATRPTNNSLLKDGQQKCIQAGWQWLTDRISGELKVAIQTNLPVHFIPFHIQLPEL